MIPPEYAPHRTATQQLGDDIVKHAAAIRRGWPHMLPEDAPPQRLGRASVSAGILREGDDDDGAVALDNAIWHVGGATKPSGVDTSAVVESFTVSV